MYRVTLKALTPEPQLTSIVLRALTGSLKSSGCTLIERPSWILASCGDNVLVKAFMHMAPAPREILAGIESSVIIIVESPRAPDAIKAVSIVMGALEGVSVGVVMEQI
ncbi:MAG: hypothetical protein P3X22_003955 [Thermoprotei archaeon]|nr:hypothetical protein [Thermoprotei archaeon]